MVKTTHQRAKDEFLSFHLNQKCEKADASSIFNDLCLSAALPAQLTLLHLDKAGRSNSSPPTMAEDIQSHRSKCTHLARHTMSTALDWSSWRRQRVSLSRCLPRLDVFIEFNFDHFLSPLCIPSLLPLLPWGLFNEEACQRVRMVCGRLRRRCCKTDKTAHMLS